MDKKLTVAGVVLRGGRSSRMGVDKAGLNFKGIPLFEHMCHLLRAAGLTHVFSSGPGGIADVLPGLGPLGGMHACMQALAGRFSHVLFVPVDMPLLSPARIRDLAWHASDAEVLQYAEQVFPLKLALTAQTRGTLDEQVAANPANRRSIKNFINALHTDFLPVEPRDLDTFSNINTPEDWRVLNSLNTGEYTYEIA